MDQGPLTVPRQFKYLAWEKQERWAGVCEGFGTEHWPYPDMSKGGLVGREATVNGQRVPGYSLWGEALEGLIYRMIHQTSPGATS